MSAGKSDPKTSAKASKSKLSGAARPSPVVSDAIKAVPGAEITAPDRAVTFSPAPKAPRITKGAASVVFFYFGDSKYTTLAQETVKLKLAMEDYKQVVLLKHDEIPNFWDLSTKDEKLADVITKPTNQNLVNHMIELAQDGYMIDLFVFSHGWTNKFRTSQGTHGQNDSFGTTDILSEFSSSRTGLTQMPIRMVYGVNCYGKTMAPTWREIGAKVTAGARYVNFYPNQFGKFANEWNKGNVTFENAVKASDTATTRTLVQTYISVVHAPSTKGQWGGCPFGRFVLGDHDCAREYFTDQWLSSSEWQSNKDGKDNMNYSSKMFIGGEKTLTKNQTPNWD